MTSRLAPSAALGRTWHPMPERLCAHGSGVDPVWDAGGRAARSLSSGGPSLLRGGWVTGPIRVCCAACGRLTTSGIAYRPQGADAAMRPGRPA